MNAQPRRAWGSLEAETMAVLWGAGGPLTPGQVQAALLGAPAYNTVLTILTRLLDKGLVRRQAAGRSHAYWPAQDAAAASAARMRAVLDGPGDRQAVLQQFAAGLDAEDTETLRALLDGDP